MELRDYQRASVDATFREWDEGRRRTLLALATGTGKTIVMAKVAERVAAQGGRTLLLAHRGELLDQARDKIERATGIECSLEQASSHGWDEDTPVCVGSVQSLAQEARLEEIPPDEFDCVMVDEAHHALSDTYTRVLDHFEGARVLGVTATPDRGDRRSLATAFDSIAYEYGMARAIHDGWLCPIEAMMVPLDIDISNVSLTNGDWAAGELGSALDPYLDAIADHLCETVPDRKTVVFLPLIETAEHLRDLLVERGMRAAEVHGTSEDRADILRDFEDGKYQVLCNSMLLTEGWDCPSVDCIVVLRPTKSRALFQQMVGRGTRLSPETGKHKLLLLDYLWNTGRHSLCRPASLFADTQEIADRATKKVEEADGAIDMMEATDEADRDVAREREESLAKQLAEQRRKKARLVDPIEYEVSIAGSKLRDYEPVFAWQRRPATEKQVRFLEGRGVDASELDCGKASLLIDTLETRRKAGLATPKQVRVLDRYGFRHSGQWTFDEANAMISRLASNNWRRPYGLVPSNYLPPSLSHMTDGMLPAPEPAPAPSRWDS